MSGRGGSIGFVNLATGRRWLAAFLPPCRATLVRNGVDQDHRFQTHHRSGIGFEGSDNRADGITVTTAKALSHNVIQANPGQQPLRAQRQPRPSLTTRQRDPPAHSKAQLARVGLAKGNPMFVLALPVYRIRVTTSGFTTYFYVHHKIPSSIDKSIYSI